MRSMSRILRARSRFVQRDAEEDPVRAWIVETPGPLDDHPLRLVELEDPEPGPGRIRVRVQVCGVCRTDLHVVEGDLAPVSSAPVVPGHQIVGRVDATGSGVSRFAPGDRVGIAWLRSTCGVCDYCFTGRENLCPSSRYTGYHANGGYAELAVVDEDFAYRIPDGFADEDAAPLLCAGIIGYRALERACVPEGGTLALFGFGSSAHVVLQLARNRGHDVYVSTRSAGHRELARRLGAVWVGGSRDLFPDPVDSAIVFAPAGDVVPPALEAVGKGGTVALAGIHMSDIPPLDYERHLFHEKSLRSVEANTREDGRRLLEEAASIPIRPEVTPFPFEEADRALERLAADEIDGSAVLVLDRG